MGASAAKASTNNMQAEVLNKGLAAIASIGHPEGQGHKIRQ